MHLGALSVAYCACGEQAAVFQFCSSVKWVVSGLRMLFYRVRAVAYDI